MSAADYRELASYLHGRRAIILLIARLNNKIDKVDTGTSPNQEDSRDFGMTLENRDLPINNNNKSSCTPR